MSTQYSPKIVTNGLVLMLDAGNPKSFPGTNSILGAWTDYGGNQANYIIINSNSIYIKNTYATWIGQYPITISTTGEYGLMFDYVGDTSAVLNIDNDGIMDNTYNSTISVTTATQTFYKSVNVTTTGVINLYMARGSGGNITVSNVRFFKCIWYDLSGNGNHGTLHNLPGYNSTDTYGSLHFNGSPQYIQANINSTILDGNPLYSVEFFIKREATLPANGGGYWGIGGTGTYNSFEGWTPVDNLIHHDTYASDRVSSSDYYPLNSYVHVVWTKSSNTAANVNSLTCYVNGVISSLSSTNVNGTIPHLNTSTSGVGVSIGRINGDADALYGTAMSISSFKIYSIALSQLEVLQNYNATKKRFGL